MMNNKENKLKNPYVIKSVSNTTKDIDISKRIVTGAFNTYRFIDSDGDMLLPGCAKKSINERGVNSTKGNKIKHLKDHDWNQNIARLNVLDERTVEINGKERDVIYHESFYPKSQDSTDLLIKIQEGLYDSRSIGFQYVQMDYYDEKDPDFDKYLAMAINPELGEANGHLWVIKEIRLWEGSDVTFGANELTPLLGIKGVNQDFLTDLLTDQIHDKLDKLEIACEIMKKGELSDEGFHGLGMEINQIKGYIASIIKSQESIKDTIKTDSRRKEEPTSLDFLKLVK